MTEFLSQLFKSDLVPHGYCLAWKPEIVWLHVLSDALITAAYYSIPVTLAYFVRRRRDLPFSWIFLFFAVFIFACGTTHLMAIWTIWEGTYRLEGLVKAFTAFVSLATAALLVPLTPKALALRSPDELERLNAALQREIKERERAECELVAALAGMEERVKQRTAELAARNAELERFGYVASHDLQEPLRVVSGYVHLLAKRYEKQLDRDALEFIAFSISAVTRMQELIDDLSGYSRVGRGLADPEAVDLEECVDRSLQNLRRAIEETQAEIIRESLPRVPGKQSELTQLFQNLIGNAVKYRDKHRPPRIQVATRADGPWWVFSVRDNGIGIEQQYSQRIFDLFERLHRGDEYPGTGIGLALCKKIVEQYGGRIWVESEPGLGSTFLFTLPRKEKESEE